MWNTSGVISPGHHKKICVYITHPAETLCGTFLYIYPAKNFAWYITLYLPSWKLGLVHPSIFTQLKTLQPNSRWIKLLFFCHIELKMYACYFLSNQDCSVTHRASTCHEGGEGLILCPNWVIANYRYYVRCKTFIVWVIKGSVVSNS